MTYKVEPKAQNELKQAIAEKVKEAVSSGQTTSLCGKDKVMSLQKLRLTVSGFITIFRMIEL